MQWRSEGSEHSLVVPEPSLLHQSLSYQNIRNEINNILVGKSRAKIHKSEFYHFIRKRILPLVSVAPMIRSGCKPLSKPRSISSSSWFRNDKNMKTGILTGAVWEETTHHFNNCLFLVDEILDSLLLEFLFSFFFKVLDKIIAVQVGQWLPSVLITKMAGKQNIASIALL